jgi:carbon-monoxide dehydrogenase small subunit
MNSMDSKIPLKLDVNGRQWEGEVPAHLTLADLLRDELRLTGTKIGCDQAVCGTCTVLVDGAPVAACSTFAFMADGATVETIEGQAAADGALNAVQAAFKGNSAFQCGYCTPGFVLLATALLREHPRPDRATIREWLSANICRCTGYQMIFEAVETAAETLAGGSR